MTKLKSSSLSSCKKSVTFCKALCAVVFLFGASIYYQRHYAQTGQHKKMGKGANPVFTAYDANRPLFSGNGGRLAVIQEVGTTNVFDIASGRKLCSFKVPDSSQFFISSDGKRIGIFGSTVTETNGPHYISKPTFQIFDIDNNKEISGGDAVIPFNGYLVNFSMSSSAGQSSRNLASDLRLILGAVPDKVAEAMQSPPDLLLGDLESKQVVQEFRLDGHVKFDIWEEEVITPNAQFVAASRRNENQADRAVTAIWEARTGKEILRLPFHSLWLALSNDGKKLVTANSSTYQIEVWETATGKRLSEINAEPSQKKPRILRGTLSPNGEILATTGTNYILLWNTRSGKLIAKQEAVPSTDDDIVKSISLSENGQYLAMSSSREITKVWLIADIIRNAAVDNREGED